MRDRMTKRTLRPREGECQAEYRAGFAGMRRCKNKSEYHGFCRRHGGGPVRCSNCGLAYEPTVHADYDPDPVCQDCLKAKGCVNPSQERAVFP